MLRNGAPAGHRPLRPPFSVPIVGTPLPQRESLAMTTRPFLLRPAVMAALVATVAFATPTGAIAFDPAAMSPAEEKAFGEAVRAYLLANPEVLIDVSRELDARQAAAREGNDRTLIAQNASQIFADGMSYVGGNPAGDVTLVEFIDYRCGYCKKAHEGVKDLVKADGNIRYIVKEFPILGEESLIASRFAVATLKVAGPEAYEKVNAGFYESFRGAVTPETLVAFGDGLGLDGKRIVAAMDGPDIMQPIIANHKLAETLSISGTPTFILGTEFVRGYVPAEELQKIVVAARAEKSGATDATATPEASGPENTASGTTATP